MPLTPPPPASAARRSFVPSALRPLAAFALILAASGLVASKPRQPRRLLVVSVTKGFHHESIPTLERVLADFAAANKIEIDYARTDDELRAKTTAARLKSYAAVVFASTTGDLPLADREALLDFVRRGGAFIGVHSATDTFRRASFPEYTRMIGGEFEGHGPQKSVRVLVNDARHPATKGMSDPTTAGERAGFTIFDEIYRINNFDPKSVRLLLSLDHHPDTGAPGLFPLAWCSTYGKGRVFYTALGHRDDVLTSERFRRHLAGGMLWAMKKG